MPSPRLRLLSFRLCAEATCSIDDGDSAAVLCIGLLGGTDHRRALLAVADGRDPGCRDPGCDEDVFGRLGAALAEREIIFARTPLVAMTLDRDRHIGIASQPIGLAREDLSRFGRDIGSVEGEEHTVAGTCLEILLRSRHNIARADAPRRTARRSGRRRLRRRAAAGCEHQQSAQQADYFYMHFNPPRRVWTISPRLSAKQGRPGWIGSVLRGRHFALIGAGQIDRVQASRSAVSTRIRRRLAEIHQYSAVRRPGWPFDQKIPRQQPFAGAIRVHYTNKERSAVDLGKSYLITARRPDRGAIFARTKADPPGVTAIRTHDIELLGAAAIGIKDDLAAVGRKAGGGI